MALRGTICFSTIKFIMLKLTVVVALLCAMAFVAECALEKATMSRHMTITMPKSTTVSMGDQMYTISMTNSNVHVNSSDPNHKPCDMAIDPTKNSIQGEMMVLTSDSMIYVMGEHSVGRVDGKDRTKYSLMMINPRDCTLKLADMSDVNVGMKPSLPRMLMNGMAVDLYFPSLQTCAPCRYNNDGVKDKMIPPQVTQPAARSDGRIFSFDIRKMGSNYLYTQNMEGRKASLKILDGKTMSVLKEKDVDYPVDTMTDTKDGMISICSKQYDRFMADITAYKQINCKRVDDKLDSTAEIDIPIEPHSRPVSRVSYNMDGEGEKTYIGFAESKDLRVYIYDAAGKLMKAYDMGQIDERFEKYKHRPMFYMPYSHWNVRGMIVGKEYCLVTEQVADKHEVDLHDVRCIDM